MSLVGVPSSISLELPSPLVARIVFRRRGGGKGVTVIDCYPAGGVTMGQEEEEEVPAWETLYFQNSE